MIFIPSAKILNISIILMMMIIFFNYSSAEPNKLFQYVVADDKDYDDYFKRNNEGIKVYTGNNVPTETNLRLGYIDDIFDETMSKIKLELSGKKVWVSIDETTDIEGRFVANVIVGILEADYPGKQYLVHSEQLEKTNYSTICRVFDKAIGIIGIPHEDVLLFTSDAAPYMTKAGNTLKAFYSKMIHITCTAHGLHRVAEEVRGKFNNVDKLISSVRKIFRKAPNRVQLFKNEAPHLNLPPEPIITRWSTWIIASNYYCENIEIIRNILEKLDADDAVSIKKAKKYISRAGIERDLAYIKSNFTILTVCITKLQEQGLPLAEAINVFENVEKAFETLKGPIGKAVFNKLNNVAHKNVGLTILKNISNVLSGNNMNTELEPGLPEDFSTDDLVYFKFAPITSADIERSFSMYKTLLSNNRRSFHFENLYKHLIIQCNFQDEEKLTIFEFYITKYNLEVEQILLSISNESLESKMERITNYCKPANEYRDPVVETEEYCLKIYRDLFQDLMICLTSICTDKEAWSYRLYNFFGMQSLVNNGTSPLTSTQERVTTVPNIIRITLKNALNNQDEMAAATPQKQDEKADTTPRLKGLSLWSGFNSQELNEEIIDKIGNKLSPCDQNAFYRCIMEFKNAMIVFNTKITRKYKKELITLEEKTNYDQPAFSNDEKKKILEYQEIALLKLLSLSSDSTIEPTLIKFLFPILTNHELENPIQKSYQKDCKFFLSFNLKSGVSVQNGYAAHIKSNGQYELSKYTIWMDDKYVMQIDKCRAIEEDYKLYALRLFYLGCIPLEKSLWWKELKSVQQLYPNIEDK